MTEVIKEGVLEQQKKGKISGKRWKVVFVVVTNGGLHIYKDSSDVYPAISISLESVSPDAPVEKDLYPTKSINLESASPDAPFEKDKAKTAFAIKTSDGVFVFACDSDADCATWTEAFKKASGKKMTLPPKKAQRGGSSPSSLLFRAKKNISGKVATSSLMKQKVLNEETRHLLDAMVAVVEKVTDAKTAAGVEKQIIKMVLKGYFQYEKGTITLEDFRIIDGVLRKAFNQVDKLFGHYQVRPSSQLTEAFAKTAGMLQEAVTGVMNLLEPHVRKENIIKMREALGVIANADFLYKVWDCPAVEHDLLSLVSAMNKYTQIELN